jgi:hypothetical protein
LEIGETLAIGMWQVRRHLMKVLQVLGTSA